MAWMKTSEALLKLHTLLLQDKFSFSFDGIPLVAEGLSARQKTNLIRLGMHTVLRSGRISAMPPIIQVEPTNLCNLKCPLCPTGSDFMKRTKGFMSIETFQKILDELGETLISVLLYGWGEPFLNKDLPKMIGACTKLNIHTVTSTNGNSIRTLDDALRVVDAGLSALIIAIDGSTQDVYRTYRKGGDIENVKRCVSVIGEAKALRGARFPYTNLRIVVTRYNRDDLPNVEKLARNLGVDMFSCKSVGCLSHSEKYRDYEPAEKKMRRYEYDDASQRRRHFIKCPYPFRQPTVFWDGSVVGCEFDYEQEVPWGKIGEQSFGDIWNSRSALNMRHCIQRGQNLPAFCDLCPYKDRVQNSQVLSRVLLRPIGNKTASTKGAP